MPINALRSLWQSLLSTSKSLSFPYWTAPIVLVAACFVSFGLAIPSLGLYFDDWHHIYYAYTRGINSLWELLLYDNRPTSASFYILGFQILGFKPLYWHLFSLVLRGSTVLLIWLCLQDIWTLYKREVFWAALLFAIYPLFKFQPVAVAYSLHWVGFLLFSISIWAMIQSIRRPRLYWPFLILSIATGILHLYLLEYFAGLELIRLMILWLLIDKEQGSARFWKIFRYWLPYLIVLSAFGVYRVEFMPVPSSGGDRNLPTLLFALTKSPLSAGIDLVQTAMQDMVSILYSVWNSVFSPEVFAFSQSANSKIALIDLLIGGALFFYLTHMRTVALQDDQSGKVWYREAFWVGLVWTLLGPLPAWITRQSITGDNILWGNRYGLGAMVGASLVIVSLLEGLVRNQKYRTIVYCILIALAIGWQVRNANDFRWAWTKQARFYSQLYWRAPYILPGTAILSDGEIFPQMTENSTSYAIGTLYPGGEEANKYKYWFYSLYANFSDKTENLIMGMPLASRTLSSGFFGDSRDSLVIYYEPEKNQCLWVLRPEDKDIRILPGITREVVAISNLDRIQIDSQNEKPFPAVIFGSEPGPTWCYYYEKADLARQLHDWQRLVDLWRDAQKKGFSPQNGVEYLPFIEGFAYTGDWQQAQKLTLQSNRITGAMDKILCPTWERLALATVSTPDRDQVMLEVEDKLGCE